MENDITMVSWIKTHIIYKNIIKNKFILFIVKLITKNEWINVTVVRTENEINHYMQGNHVAVYKRK